MAASEQLQCPACLGPRPGAFARFADGDFFRCPACALLFSPNLEPLRRDGLQRSAVVGALEHMREVNFALILDDLVRRYPSGARLLEVGSSTGVFLERAAQRGFEVHGVEPDPFFVQISIERYPKFAGSVLTGYFPAVRPAGTFDIICFNDVFEHIPDAPAIMAASRDLLSPGGCVSLSIPASEGFFFHFAVAAHRLGFHYPLVRMLQLDFPYPHLYYFSVSSMRALAGRLGMQVTRHAPLEILTAGAIEARFAMDSRPITGLGIRVTLAKLLFAFYRVSPAAWAKPDLLHFILERHTQV